MRDRREQRRMQRAAAAHDPSRATPRKRRQRSSMDHKPVSLAQCVFAFQGFLQAETAPLVQLIAQHGGVVLPGTTLPLRLSALEQTLAQVAMSSGVYVITSCWSDVRFPAAGSLPREVVPVTEFWLREMVATGQWLEPDSCAFFQPPQRCNQLQRTELIAFPMDYTHERSDGLPAVLLPCSPKNTHRGVPLWPYVVSILHAPMANSNDLSQVIHRLTDMPAAHLEPLRKSVDEIMTDSERQRFFQTVLPRMVQLVLDLPQTFRSPPPLLCPVTSASTQLPAQAELKTRSCDISKLQALSLLASCWFCAVPNQKALYHPIDDIAAVRDAQFPYFDMSMMYCGRGHVAQRKAEKIRTVAQYFLRIVPDLDNRRSELEDQVLTFTRVSILCSKGASSAADHAAQVLQIATDVCRDSAVDAMSPITIESSLLIEDLQEQLQIDFANEFAGGGVFNAGCVQEEIRFIVSPELLISCLLFAKLEAFEAFVIHGSERYSNYQGYAGSYQFDGNFDDATPFEQLSDQRRRRKCVVVGIDAVDYMNCAVWKQYTHNYVRRDLLKAFVGFAFPETVARTWPVATGNWGCGAFCGDPQLKFLLQWAAASMAGRAITYVLFGRDHKLHEAVEIAVGSIEQATRSPETSGILLRSVVEFLFELEDLLVADDAHTRWPGRNPPTVLALLSDFMANKLGVKAGDTTEAMVSPARARRSGGSEAQQPEPSLSKKKQQQQSMKKSVQMKMSAFFPSAQGKK